MPEKKYKRILLKLSGEMLLEGQSFGIQPAACKSLAHSIKKFTMAGYEVGIVIGGGNLFRGINLQGFDMPQTSADQIGMLATLMNGIALQQSLEQIGCSTRILSAIDCPKIADTYTLRTALESISSGKIVIFVGGTGNPYFTTDTAAALRASEINADIILKATKVDGVYTKDPIKHVDAVKYDQLSYTQMLAEKLEVMDATAITLCRNSGIPILVFNMHRLKTSQPNEILSQNQGTLISGT